MKIVKHFLLASAAILLTTLAYAETVKPVKYVFLFIGDGMSIPQRMMTDEYLQRTEKRQLLINQLPYQAITTTRAANEFITDSAASGTAIACGEKTNNGRIGMDASGKRNLESVAEVARDSGRKVGIITSVTLNHATPAAFYGHNPSRGNGYQLGLDLIKSEFDYFGGGGISGHNSTKDKQYQGDVYELAQKAGYKVLRSEDDIKNLQNDDKKVIAIGASDSLPYAIDAPKDAFKLADYTRQAIARLDNDKGFFMMVEGGKIDWMCHANDAATTLHEVIDFDNAVKVAHDFAQKHPEDTLIVVTGDHETGGLTLGFAGTGYKSYIERLAQQTVSRDVMKERFQQQKNIDFNKIKPLITEVSGLIFKTGEERGKGGLHLTSAEEKELENAFNRRLKDGALTSGSVLADAVIRTLNNKSGIAWTSGAHTALPVSTTAYGVSGHLFTSMIDNTDIAKKLKLLVR